MPNTFVEAVLQDAAEVDGNGNELVMDGYVRPVFQISGTFTAEVYPEATLDGTNWVALRGVTLDEVEGEAAGTNFGSGLIVPLYPAPFHAVRARIASYSEGAVTVIARAIA